MKNFYKAIVNWANPPKTKIQVDYDKFFMLLSQANVWAESREEEAEKGIINVLIDALQNRINEFDRIDNVSISIKDIIHDEKINQQLKQRTRL